MAAANITKWKRLQIEPQVARDRNPDPEVVEVVIVAREKEVVLGNGLHTRMYTYNNSVPGPTIKGNLGDTLIVHFYNRLPEGTTIHWHGLELPANMDGSHIAQNPVPPGGYFRYEFKLLRAATFWYHPHIRTHEQVERGLHGALVVYDPEQDAELGLPDIEHMLVLDDILLDADADVAEAFPADPLDNAITQVNGRIGNVLLVNGKYASTGIIPADQPQRLRLINVSNSRFMRISLPGHRVWRIGGDGGLLENPIAAEPIDQIHSHHNPDVPISNPDPAKGILLTPGERADVIFTPQTTHPIQVQWHDIARGRHSAFYMSSGAIGLGHDHLDGMLPPEAMMTLLPFGRVTGPEMFPPAELRQIDEIDATGAPTIMVMMGHTAPDQNGDVTFFVQMKDGAPLPFAAITSADAPVVQVGDTRIWSVNNMTGGDHNFHTHGFHFQHVDTKFVDMDTPENNFVVPASHLEDKDTILVPRRPGAKGRSRTIVRLKAVFDDTGREGQIVAFGKIPDGDLSGGWVFHCHLLEHAAQGMMSFLQVVE
jgi:FtsP/CotA-like multicopper oxidase with cupredoxin domain